MKWWEWVFSGVGVLALALFIEWLRRRSRSSPQSASITAQDAKVVDSPVASGTGIIQTVNSPTINVSLPAPAPGSPGNERYNEWRELIDEIHESRTTLGGCMDPHAAWLLLRGIRTLAVRVQRHNENALRVSQFLNGHPKVRRTHYPFLEGHPQRALAMEQMHGGGGVLSFEVDGNAGDARRLAESLNLFRLAPSLGGVDSLVTIPALTSPRST